MVIEAIESTNEDISGGEGSEDTLSISNAVEAAISEVDKSRESTPLDKEQNSETLEVEAKESSAQRQRDEKGRFRVKQEEVLAPQEEDPLPPPQNWRKEHKELFSKGPRELQEAIHEREKELFEFTSRLQSRASKAEHVARTFEEIVKPYGYLLDKHGVDAPEAVSRLFHWQQRLESSPENTLHDIAASYGFQIQVTDRPQGNTQTSAEEERLRYELDQLRQEKETQLKELSVNQTRTLVQSWASERDGNGKLLRPYFEDFRPQIREAVSILESRFPDASPQEVLEAAYQDTIKKMEARGYIRKEQDLDAIRAKTLKAKTAASSLKTEPSDEITPKTTAMTVQDAIAKAMAMHS